jgi:hypothetical protein
VDRSQRVSKILYTEHLATDVAEVNSLPLCKNNTQDPSLLSYEIYDISPCP